MIDHNHCEQQERLWRNRSRRVILLIVGIVVLSLGDLVITVTCLTTTGMIEANPVADFIIRQTGSVAVLAAYKALTVAICVGLLFRLRRHVEGEVAAWCAILILAVLSLHWYHYVNEFEGLTDVEFAAGVADGEAWLVLH